MDPMYPRQRHGSYAYLQTFYIKYSKGQILHLTFPHRMLPLPKSPLPQLLLTPIWAVGLENLSVQLFLVQTGQIARQVALLCI